ncbi:hypothetical protein [Actinobacillus seminis]|uniref:hypothetical protein n=1 Tax=Actinobacillus seminis TaxID=722 RepID=UPI00130371D7|nr:hypothetical protein [Actinobacillus seminis]
MQQLQAADAVGASGGNRGEMFAKVRCIFSTKFRIGNNKATKSVILSLKLFD